MAGLSSYLTPPEKFLTRIIPAIGLVANRWTQVEIVTQRLMGQLLRLEGRFGIALTAHIADRTALDIILSVARQYALEKDTQAAIEAFATGHGTCRENRNLIVHGVHGRSEKGLKPRRNMVQKVTSRGKVKVSYFELELPTIYRVAEEIWALAGYGQGVLSHLETTAPGKVPHALPGLFPRLDNLLNTLPQLTVHDVLRRRSFGSGWTELKA